MATAMIANSTTNWSTLLNILIQTYFSETNVICIFWHNNTDFILESPTSSSFSAFLSIWPDSLQDAFQKDVYDFAALEYDFIRKGLEYDDWVLKLTAVIEDSHCEGFIAFDEHIPVFSKAFYYSAVYSVWRSIRNKFLFAYRKAMQQAGVEYFEERLFRVQSNILLVEAEERTSTSYAIKTNKFVGSVHHKPEEFILVNTFNSLTATFAAPLNQHLFQQKLQDLQGREIGVGILHYPPYSAVDYHREPQVRDRWKESPTGTVYIGGTEIYILKTFCEMYNCTVEADTSEKEEWGEVYENATASGLMGLMTDDRIEVVVGGIYHWYNVYRYIDLTVYLGLASVTCMVPKPQKLANWDLPVRPFQFTLWVGVIGCLSLEIISLCFARRLEVGETCTPNGWFKSFQFGYVTVLKLIIQQSSSSSFSSVAVRIVMFSCYMIQIIISSIYDGSLASMLTVPVYGEAADTVERLYTHKLPLISRSHDFVIAIQSAEDNPILYAVSNNFVQKPTEQITVLAETVDMAFIFERLTFGHFANAEFLTPLAMERLKLMADYLDVQATVSLVARAWPLEENYNTLILNLHACGVEKLWEWRVAADFLDEHEQVQILASKNLRQQEGPVSLDMRNFVGLLLVWVAGIILCIIAFCLELCWYRRKKHQQTTN